MYLICLTQLLQSPAIRELLFFSWFGIVRDGKIRYDQTTTGLFEMFVDQTDEEEISKAITLMRAYQLDIYGLFKRMHSRIRGSIHQ